MDLAWVEALDSDNYLAVFDVLSDVERELNILADQVSIAAVPDVVRFPQLMPMDGINFRDNYANARWKATQFLAKKGIFKSVDIDQGLHRWQSRFVVSVDEEAAREAITAVRADYQRRLPSEGEEVVTRHPTALSRLESLLLRFHLVVVQLRKRREDRKTLDVGDEYDVQDLLRAMLAIDFDDVRPEEWTPSYAGKSSRTDFLLKNEEIVLEVKKTRPGLSEKELGDQLIIDIERYRQMKGASTLVCFVYDPDDRIANPMGFETDLSREEDGFEVRVIVGPRRH